MNSIKEAKLSILDGSPKCVAVVASRESLEFWLTKKSRETIAHFVEFRVDALLDDIKLVREELERASFPNIITVRDPAEGGVGSLTHDQREDLYHQLAPMATFMDVEIRNLDRFSSLIEDRKSWKTGLIASFHDFEKTPNFSVLESNLTLAKASGAEMGKFACKLNAPKDIIPLTNLVKSAASIPVSMMGMGTLGMPSRLLMAACGSVLNYGFIGKSNAPGQWPAARLKKLIAEIQQ